MRAVWLLLALALAGCTGGQPPVSSADGRLPFPPECMTDAGGCPYRHAAPPCAMLKVDAEPADVGHIVRVELANGCDEPFYVRGSSSGSLEKHGIRAGVVVDGQRYHLMDGAAWSTPSVLPAVPPGDVLRPGERLAASWTWNGTLAEFRSDCRCTRYEPAPAGVHDLEASLVRAPDVRATARVVVDRG